MFESLSIRIPELDAMKRYPEHLFYRGSLELLHRHFDMHLPHAGKKDLFGLEQPADLISTTIIPESLLIIGMINLIMHRLTIL